MIVLTKLEGSEMTKTYAEQLEESRGRVREVTPDEVMADTSGNLVLLDCREPAEWNLAHIPGAVFIPLGNVEAQAEAAVARESKVVVYCASGNRSLVAADTLTAMGYSDVASMRGGIRAWHDAGGPVE